VDEDQIEPYMAEINRQFEYIDKEDIIKKMVTITFGKFLAHAQFFKCLQIFLTLIHYNLNGRPNSPSQP
jgi:hypothetical protein